jgi:Rrf2 family transcriptional regulator, iron-sulfur cluster assembly transcription factor
MFSKACEYAIRATIFIASESLQRNRVSLKEIAKSTDSPEAFTAKILQKLVKANIILSIKGAGGGFETDLSKYESIKLVDIVFAIDGDAIYKRCSLGLHNCSEVKPCPFHHKYKPLKEKLQHLLETTNLNELIAGLPNGDTFLKI